MHGELQNVEISQIFADREECRKAGVHRADVAGITGYGGGQPAESIVVSGGYEDDEDHGDLIIYTGDGGRDDKAAREQTVCNSQGIRLAEPACRRWRCARKTIQTRS